MHNALCLCNSPLKGCQSCYDDKIGQWEVAANKFCPTCINRKVEVGIIVHAFFVIIMEGATHWAMNMQIMLAALGERSQKEVQRALSWLIPCWLGGKEVLDPSLSPPSPTPVVGVPVLNPHHLNPLSWGWGGGGMYPYHIPPVLGIGNHSFNKKHPLFQENGKMPVVWPVTCFRFVGCTGVLELFFLWFVIIK